MTETRFVVPPFKTWFFLVLSVCISAFITLGFFGFVEAYLREDTLRSAEFSFIPVYGIATLLGLTVVATVIMSIPGLLIGIPTYILLSSDRSIELRHCIFCGAFISTISGFTFLQFTVFTSYVEPFGLYFMLIIGGILAGFVFHRLEKGRWT